MCYLDAMCKKLPLASLLLILLGSPAWADIYKHVDEHGNITFTNTPVRGAQRIFVEPGYAAPRQANKAKNGEAGTPRVNTPSPTHFPRVDSGTQKERDVNRQRILQDELASEQRLLAEQKKALADAETNRSAEEKANPQKYLERIGRLRERLQLHEKNVAALQIELGKNR
ncbi:MAG: hypothetical protein H6R07_2336 [Proteobacteria bacterium]|nr:hypothetical protein [Pseudomonadota bacterium]